MPGEGRPAFNLFTRFLRFFFYLIYEPMAWSYDLVAWVVSLGRWKTWISTTLPELSGPRVLELGHGPGHLQSSLAKRGIYVFGVDRSASMGRLARRRLTGVEHRNLVRALAEQLPFPTRVFDQLVATFPTEYIVQPATLSEAKRVLRGNGKLIVLPVAWIRGSFIWDRIAAWLFRATGQAPDWDPRFSQPLRKAGFDVFEKRIESQGSEVILLHARIIG